MRTTPPTHRDLWRAGCVDEAHVRFGRRAGETLRLKHRQGAPVRPHHVNIRLEQHKLCLLVMIGVRADRPKALHALGERRPQSTEALDDMPQLLACYDYPAEHWVHLRTTNPIESTFATVRHRTKVTKGPGSRAAGLAMAFKLIESAQDHWRMVNAPHLVALVRAGATFKNGKLAERPGEQAKQEAA